jgi:16S rRNA (guanine527-N7)-methyltransferase
MKNELEAAVGKSVSRETIDQLAAYVELLRLESGRHNLISATTLDDIWMRHIVDSAQLVQFEAAPGASWVDIGSGAGLPGIVVACLVEGSVTLVEPRRLRAEFLRDVVTNLGLSAVVVQAKVERVSGKFDMITGRAVAALPRFLSLCDHLSTRNAVWVLPKGQNAQSELVQARRAWQGVFHVEQSVTDEKSKIIVATGVRAKRQ